MHILLEDNKLIWRSDLTLIIHAAFSGHLTNRYMVLGSSISFVLSKKQIIYNIVTADGMLSVW